MKNDRGDAVGIIYRMPDGRKLARKGSRNGLFMPMDLTSDGLVFIAEGATDTAALLSIGLEGIGVSSAGSEDSIRSACRLLRGRSCVVVGDNDESGIRSATSAAHELKLFASCVRLLFPPADFKDVRDWVVGGATGSEFLRAANAAAPLTIQVRGAS
jgi:phage/plasmid primase-like uncharacterized protein